MKQDKSEVELVFIGFPESGKTTFLIATYAAILHRLTGVAISLISLPEDSTYLNEHLQHFLRYEPMPHTNTGSLTEITLRIRVEGTGQEIALRVPDVNGEEFNSQWEDRECSDEYSVRVGSAQGILLFIRTDAKNEMPLSDQNEIAPPQEKSLDVSDEYSPKDAPIGAKLVDLLQIAVQLRPDTKAPCRLAIIASAWDVELSMPEVMRRTPANWLRGQVPLLHQFLEANQDLFCYEVFGVSAQGGDYETQREELAGKPSSKRFLVQKGDQHLNDITVPLLWTIDGAS